MIARARGFRTIRVPLGPFSQERPFSAWRAVARILIGLEKTFWVKIAVGDATVPTYAAAATSAAPTGAAVPTTAGTATTPRPPGSCRYVTSGSYPDEIASMINQARASAGLPELTINAQLQAAAQSHSIDMACFSFNGNKIITTGGGGALCGAGRVALRAALNPQVGCQLAQLLVGAEMGETDALFIALPIPAQLQRRFGQRMGNRRELLDSLE